MTDSQANLFGDIAAREFEKRHADDPPGIQRPSIQERFERFHAENPEVYRMFCRIAAAYARKGHKYVSAKDIFEQIRVKVDTRHEGLWKLNNNFTALYARLFMDQHPDYKPMFRTRMRKAA